MEKLDQALRNYQEQSDKELERSGITWIHLSDWHQRGQDFNRTKVRDKLIQDILQREHLCTELKQVDFIIFSGDLAFSGKAEEYEAAKTYLFEPVLKATSLSRESLFIVPGNHDLDRDEFEILPQAILNPFESEDQVQEWLENRKKRQRLLEPFAVYKQFVSEYTGQKSPDYASVRQMEINNRRIALLGINSALMAGRKNQQGDVKDEGKLIVGEPQIYAPLRQIETDDLRIAVLHHPFNWLKEFDRRRIEKNLGEKCQFILCGHEHDPRVQQINGTRGNYVLIPTGASYDRRDWANSYNFVHLDLETGKGSVYLRRWSDRADKWIKDEDTWSDGLYPIALYGESTLSKKKLNET